MSKDLITVALADDHAILRKGLVSILNSYEGLSVVADAGDGKALLEQMQRLKAPPVVVVLDINMPVMDGFTTAQTIRKNWPLVKILALSMYDSEETIIKMLRSGAHGYVLKDVDPNELCKAIIHLRSNQFYYSELVTGRVLNLAYQPEEQRELTEKEKEFLVHACTELTYKEIAEKMCVSPRTVDGYRESLFKKLHVTSRVGLAMYAIKTGVVKI